MKNPMFRWGFLLAGFILFFAMRIVPGRAEEKPDLGKNLSQAQHLCEAMTPEKQIGQLFFLAFAGKDPTPLAEKWVTQWNLGGVAFFGSNAPDEKSLKELINWYKNTALRKETPDRQKIPLFLATDHEPGSFMAIRLGRTFPNNHDKLQKMNATDKKQYVARISGEMAEDLKNWGINTNFYPVLDLYYPPDKFGRRPVGHRVFSHDPAEAGELGSIAVREMQTRGVLATIKHFPGHGDTTLDSHYALPVITKPWKELWENDITPFKIAIQENPAFLMTAHIRYPELDKKYPATMSAYFLQNIIRGKLNFKGIIITDDLMMGAMIKNYDLREVAYRSIKNGMDMLLITRRKKEAATPEEIHAYLMQQYRDGDFQKRVVDSCSRILWTKMNHGLY